MRDKLIVVSGGQTGVDQAALKAARASGVKTGGFACKGWQTEDGPAPWLAGYGLAECEYAGYPARTRANVFAATACVWIGNPHSPGGKLTASLCVEANIDWFTSLRGDNPREACDWLCGWVLEPADGPVTLMVAGNRESKTPGIGAAAEMMLVEMLALLAEVKA